MKSEAKTNPTKSQQRSKKKAKPQPVIKDFCIGDPSSEEDDDDEVEKAPISHKPVVIGGHDDPVEVKTVVEVPVVKPSNPIIGDLSDDEGDQAAKSVPETIINLSSEENLEYAQKLADIYYDKKQMHERTEKIKEENLKKYEEEGKYKDFTKLADSDDENAKVTLNTHI